MVQMKGYTTLKDAFVDAMLYIPHGSDERCPRGEAKPFGG